MPPDLKGPTFCFPKAQIFPVVPTEQRSSFFDSDPADIISSLDVPEAIYAQVT